MFHACGVYILKKNKNCFEQHLSCVKPQGMLWTQSLWISILPGWCLKSPFEDISIIVQSHGAGGWVADGIPLWFATVGSFPHCKWDCKWCWWRSCRWSCRLTKKKDLSDFGCFHFLFKINFFCSGVGATISDAVARSSIVFCNSVSADRIVMAASRLRRTVAAFVILLSFAARLHKSSWSGCMKAAK